MANPAPTLSVPSEKDGAGVRAPVDGSIDQASIDAGPPRAKSDTYRNWSFSAAMPSDIDGPLTEVGEPITPVTRSTGNTEIWPLIPSAYKCGGGSGQRAAAPQPHVLELFAAGHTCGPLPQPARVIRMKKRKRSASAQQVRVAIAHPFRET